MSIVHLRCHKSIVDNNDPGFLIGVALTDCLSRKDIETAEQRVKRSGGEDHYEGNGAVQDLAGYVISSSPGHPCWIGPIPRAAFS